MGLVSADFLLAFSEILEANSCIPISSSLYFKIVHGFLMNSVLLLGLEVILSLSLSLLFKLKVSNFVNKEKKRG